MLEPSIDSKELSQKCHDLAKKLPTTGSWFYQPLILPHGLGLNRGRDRARVIQTVFGGKPFNSFLDLGCNMGHILYLARQAGAERVLGVESNEKIIEVISLAGKVWGYQVKHGLLQDYIFDQDFDIITLFNVLHHRLGDKDPIKEIEKYASHARMRLVLEVPVTEKKGIMVSADRGPDSYWKWLFNIHDLKQFLLTLGFSRVETGSFFGKDYNGILRLTLIAIRDEKN